MKKIIAVLIILIAVSGAVFFIGWVQFLVEPGQCGVLVSKTGGVDSEPIQPGVFSWKWERLLPTNAQIRIFPMESQTFTKTVSDSLPSAKIYSNTFSDKPDFTYSMNCEITIGISSSGLISLVKSQNIKDTAALQSYLDNTADSVSYSVMAWILSEAKKKDVFLPQNISTQNILKNIDAVSKYPYVIISSVSIKSIKIPDMQLYEKAKVTYTQYQNKLNTALKKKAVSEADSIAENDRSIKKLESIGELLQKYPTLSDFFKSQNSGKILNGLELN